jgi:pimeloyl-ACP methyl ester carboxylesterase
MQFFAAQDGAPIFFTDAGEGSAVILIHGWPLNADMWEYQRLDLLRKGLRVITYDRRGFGRSEQTAIGYDYNTLADDLNSLIEYLDLDQVALVGFSMGGGEIARYLKRYGPDRISCATLISSVTPYMLKDSSNLDGVDESVFAKMISGLEEDRPHFLTDFTKQFFGENVLKHPVSEETKNWCLIMALQASLKASIDCLTAFSQTDFRPDMVAFTIPTLIIHGTGDKNVPIATAGEATSKLIPSATFKTYEGAPHGLVITHKQQLNLDLYEFLEAYGSQNIKSIINRGALMDNSKAPPESTLY